MLTVADLFKMQNTLNERVGLDAGAFQALFSDGKMPDTPSPAYRKRLADAGEWIDDMLKAMSSEIEELRDCTYWKHWCTEAQEGRRYEIKDIEAARKEVIDMLHFWISLAQILGMTPEMVCGMYSSKLAKNIKRQDDGYSIEEKDLAWKLFCEHPYDNPFSDAHDRNVQSLEDLPEKIAAWYLDWAKRKRQDGDRPICYKCGCRCRVGYAVTGDGPVCVKCL
jgi:hypothetical protein